MLINRIVITRITEKTASFYKGSWLTKDEFNILGRYMIIGLLFFWLPMQSWAEDISNPDSLVQVNCQLKDKINKKPIAFAHVINRGLNIAVVTDTLGFFSTVMRRNDTLLITSIGYVEVFFFLPRFWPSNYYKGLILIGEKTYPIREVSVTSFGNYQQFKQKVANYNPPKPPIEKVTEKLQVLSRQEAVEWDKVRVGFNFSMKSKEEKSLENLKLILAEQEKQRSEERRVGKECRSRWSPYH